MRKGLFEDVPPGGTVSNEIIGSGQLSGVITRIPGGTSLPCGEESSWLYSSRCGQQDRRWKCEYKDKDKYGIKRGHMGSTCERENMKVCGWVWERNSGLDTDYTCHMSIPIILVTFQFRLHLSHVNSDYTCHISILERHTWPVVLILLRIILSAIATIIVTLIVIIEATAVSTL